MPDSTNDPAQEPQPDPIREASLKHRPEARIVEEALPASVLATIAGRSLKQVVGPAGYKSYIDKLLEDSWQPNRPDRAAMARAARLGTLQRRQRAGESRRLRMAPSWSWP